jgi:PiT family inorganic phosphate transporter
VEIEWLHKDVPEGQRVPFLDGIIGAIVVNMPFVTFGGRSVAVTIASWLPDVTVASIDLPRMGITLVVATAGTLLLAWDMTDNKDQGLRHFLLVLGGLVAFSAGASQVGLAVGPLIPLLDVLPITLLALLIGGGLGLLAGSWMGAPRMIKALAQDHSSLGPRRSIAALVPAFALAHARTSTR